jgi:NAD(P)-dependent dehydrogenase (short-subunit alcohol dehydrogenase family)
MMPMNEKQRRVVVTGAGRGLGEELVRHFAEGGASVWGTTRSASGKDDLQKHLMLDLMDEASIASAAASLAEQTDGIDILVNCAAVDARNFGVEPDRCDVQDISAEAMASVFQVNVTGPLLVQQHMHGLLCQGRNPIIVNISSQLGSMVVGDTVGSDVAYNISKAGLNMLSRRAAASYASDGITVVMMHPGWLKTDMGGSNADLEVSDAAQQIVATIQELTFEDSGSFIRWDGTVHPW